MENRGSTALRRDGAPEEGRSVDVHGGDGLLATAGRKRVQTRGNFGRSPGHRAGFPVFDSGLRELEAEDGGDFLFSQPWNSSLIPSVLGFPLQVRGTRWQMVGGESLVVVVAVETNRVNRHSRNNSHNNRCSSSIS